MTRTDPSQINFLASVSPRRLELLERRLTNCQDPACFCDPIVIDDRLTKDDVKDLCVSCVRDNLVRMWKTTQCASDPSLRAVSFTIDFRPSSGFELNLRDNSGAATDEFFEGMYANLLEASFTDVYQKYVFASDIRMTEPLSQVSHTQVAMKLLGSGAHFETFKVGADKLYVFDMAKTFPGRPSIFDVAAIYDDQHLSPIFDDPEPERWPICTDPTSPSYDPSSPRLDALLDARSSSPLFPVDDRNVSFPPDYALLLDESKSPEY